VCGGADEGAGGQSTDDAGGNCAATGFGRLWSGDRGKSKRRCRRHSSQDSGCFGHGVFPWFRWCLTQSTRKFLVSCVFRSAVKTLFLDTRFLFFA
jgi:hypothetical protein